MCRGEEDISEGNSLCRLVCGTEGGVDEGDEVPEEGEDKSGHKVAEVSLCLCGGAARAPEGPSGEAGGVKGWGGCCTDGEQADCNEGTGEVEDAGDD